MVMDIPATIAQELNLPLDIHLQIHKIWNIEVGKSNLLPLILGDKKIPSTPINAYSMYLQEIETVQNIHTYLSKCCRDC